MGKMGGSPTKLMGAKKWATKLPRRLPIVPESASFAGRVDGGRLMGFTGARREPNENQGRSGM